MVSINNRLKGQWEHIQAEAGCAWSALQSLPHTARVAVDDRPVAMTFAAFGLGIGVGAALGLVIHEMSAAAPAPSGSFAREAFRAMSNALPEALSRHFPT